MVDWHEIGSPENGISQLNFALPLAAKTPVSRCAVPFGLTDRPALAQDVPCCGLIASCASDGEGVALLSDCKYGFRNDGSGFAVDLIRASFDPDPTPEIGLHPMTLGVAVSSCRGEGLLCTGDCFAHPVSTAANTVHKGSLAPNGSVLSVAGARLSAIKQAEDGRGLILRLYNPSSAPTEARMLFPDVLRLAETVSLTEQPCAGACLPAGNLLTVPLAAGTIVSVRIVL